MFTLYLSDSLSSKQLQLFFNLRVKVKVRVKEVYLLYTFLTTTIVR
jgi:hypothetical protein